MNPEAADWFERRTWHRPPWGARELAAAKHGRQVSVVLPALNEGETVGGVVSTLLPLTAPTASGKPLVDELVVIDSGSSDGTRRIAEDAGARVLCPEDVLPEYETRPGKGEALWRSVAATSGDVLVFLDADLADCDAGFVPALLGPLLTLPEPMLVKGFYRRPVQCSGHDPVDGPEHAGGRVTELLARPALSALSPALSGVAQPLGGEYAARREFLESVPFAAGYGVEMGLLLDAYAGYSLEGLAQVNLGTRHHRHQDLLSLGLMARQVLDAVLRRTGTVQEETSCYSQFLAGDDGVAVRCSELSFAERPPLRGAGRDDAVTKS